MTAKLREDTPAEQREHYPNAIARASRPWPSRSEWEEGRHVVNDIDVANAREGVTRAAEEYGTIDEIFQAITELRIQWKASLREMRAANAAARQVFPMHRDKVAGAAVERWYRAWDALTPEAQAIVNRARGLKDGRARLHELIRDLERGTVSRTRAGTKAVLPDGTTPTYDLILGRVRAAGDAAAEEHIRMVQNLPTDDEAWRKELTRREGLERYFRDGPVVRRAS